jgi:type II secretory pathway component GspD/PulD (secretin)
MKTTLLTPSLWLGVAALAVSASAQDAVPAAPAPDAAAPAPARATPPATPAGSLRFNFRGAPLEAVLNYMSDAAGFIIVLDTPVRGTVDMWSSQPVSREEAVQLLNVALNKNGYTATVQGRQLIISSRDDAKKKNIPIRTGNDPQEIPMTAEMVMQIIPLRRIDATQASRDLATLLPGSATLTANQDSNSLVVTDTNINVRHIVEIVSALDSSADTISTMKMFKLKNADPVEMAQLITSIYSSPTTGGNNQGRGNGGNNPFAAFGARGGQLAAAFGGGGGGGNRGGGNGGRGNTSTSRSTPVVAIADPRTYSVVVTASKDAMPEIGDIIAQLDSSSARKQKVYVYTLENADVKQVETVLRNLFQSSNARAATSTQADPLATRAANNAQTSASQNTLNLNSTSRGN